MIQILTQSLVPIFVCLVFGYVAGLRNVVGNRNTKELVTFLMSFALPCGLFVTIVQTSSGMLRSHLNVAVVLGLSYFFSFVITYYAARLLRNYPVCESAVLALTAGFPNYAAVGIPVAAAIYGAEANISAVIALTVGSVTVTPLTIVIFEIKAAGGGERSRFEIVRTALWRSLKKPVFWAPMLGVVMVLAELQLPSAFEKGLAILGNASEGAALFVTGLVASTQRLRFSADVGVATLIKSVLQPLLSLGVAVAMGVPHNLVIHIVFLSAVPSGFFGLLIGAGYGAESEVASSSLIATTVGSILTLPVWIFLLGAAR